MAIFPKLFILLLTIFLALSSSGIEKASAGRHHRKSRSKLRFKPTIPTLPFTSIPCVPAVHNVTWDFNIKGWPYGKTFRTGDILVFNYDKDLHNVVPVTEEDYSSCSVPALPTVYSSGRDVLMLRRGVNYFICGTMGHCIAGMLIAVTAT